MPVSDPQTINAGAKQPDVLAVWAEILYLVNLLLLPVVAFVMLLALFYLKKNTSSAVAYAHMRQAVTASLWGGVLLFVLNGILLLLGGYDGPYVWMFVIIYFTLGHSTFILLGVIGLIKALAGQFWPYPLVGYRPENVS